jgi:hypothetical protein
MAVARPKRLTTVIQDPVLLPLPQDTLLLREPLPEEADSAPDNDSAAPVLPRRVAALR